MWPKNIIVSVLNDIYKYFSKYKVNMNYEKQETNLNDFIEEKQSIVILYPYFLFLNLEVLILTK